MFGAESLEGRQRVCELVGGLHRDAQRSVGELDLTYETMQLVADAGLLLFVYTAEPGSKSAEAMNLLASWVATPEEAEAPNR